jgi:hypothetical protein
MTGWVQHVSVIWKLFFSYQDVLLSNRTGTFCCFDHLVKQQVNLFKKYWCSYGSISIYETRKLLLLHPLWFMDCPNTVSLLSLWLISCTASCTLFLFVLLLCKSYIVIVSPRKCNTQVPLCFYLAD